MKDKLLRVATTVAAVVFYALLAYMVCTAVRAGDDCQCADRMKCQQCTDSRCDCGKATRVRVALALAACDRSCGKCGTDLNAARQEAGQTGKTLVLFVGSCYGRANELPANCIPVRVPSYDRDGQRADKARIVIVRAKGGELKIGETLPPGVEPEALKAAVKGGVKWKS